MGTANPRIALVTPHSWTAPHPVNDHIRELAAGLIARGSRPIIMAPSSSATAMRATRRALRQLAHGTDPDTVLSHASLQHEVYGGAQVPIFSVGVPLGKVSVANRVTVRTVLEQAGVDVVHCHDPVGTGLSRPAVRQSQGLVVATVHDVEGLDPTASSSGRIFDYIDLTLAGSPAAAEFVNAASSTADPQIVHTLCAMHPAATTDVPAGVVIGRGHDDDKVVRLLIRHLADMATGEQVTLLSRWIRSRRPRTPQGLRGNLSATRPTTRDQADAILARARVYIATPATPARATAEAIAAGLPVIRVDRDSLRKINLAGEIAAAVATSGASSAADVDESPLPTTADMASDMLARYAELLHHRRPGPTPRPRSTSPSLDCVIDMHMHTNHSWDCATDPEALMWTAEKIGLTAIAVTDHNEVSGAFACAELADEYNVQVIIGEEVMTDEGEVIGLFLNERIDRDMSWDDTLDAIREQDGVVYVPHPFDRLHTIPSAATLRRTLDRIDVLETCNGRLAFEQFNRDAQRFARRYNMLEGAGSDAHVVQGLGAAHLEMPAFTDAESFLAGLQHARIARNPKSFAYVQGLKFIQTRTGKTGQAPPHDDT